MHIEAAVAMWWDIAPSMRAEFEDWHSREHFPERMGIPGFMRGSRWRHNKGGDGFFVLYELETYDALSSKHYLDRLNNPTPWSRKMMPHHLNMVRSQCRVLRSFGGGIGCYMSTIRFSPSGDFEAIKTALLPKLALLVTRPGLTGCRLMKTDTPKIEQTTEQRIRGGDTVADWIILINGFDADALNPTNLADELQLKSDSQPQSALYRLSYTLAKADLES